MNEIKGSIVKIFETQQITDSFSKREFVVQTMGEYPQQIIMQLTQSNCSKIESFTEGENVTVSYNIRGRAYEKDGITRWFNSIEAWKIVSDF